MRPSPKVIVISKTSQITDRVTAALKTSRQHAKKIRSRSAPALAAAVHSLQNKDQIQTQSKSPPPDTLWPVGKPTPPSIVGRTTTPCNVLLLPPRASNACHLNCGRVHWSAKVSHEADAVLLVAGVAPNLCTEPRAGAPIWTQSNTLRVWLTMARPCI